MHILWTSVGSVFLAKKQDAPATRRNNQVLTKEEVDEILTLIDFDNNGKIS